MITANIIADSISHVGKRITTLELVYPRFIHAEVMTHRAFSRNASSSRAIPVNKAVNMALDEMVYPVRWGKNQSGMQAKGENLDEELSATAKLLWEYAARRCASAAQALGKMGVHKQWANRMIEWFSNIRVLVTATEWDNFFQLRDHPDAQDEIQILAQEIKKAMANSTPVQRSHHTPYVEDWENEKWGFTDACKLSAARCCRVSYLKHDGTDPSYEEDMALFDRLAGSRPIHASPLEHQGLSYKIGAKFSSRNFRGWIQFREMWEDGNELEE